MTATRTELLAALLHRGGIGVAIVDADARFRYVNARMADINGRTAAEHVGATIGEILPELEEVLLPIIARVIETQTPLHDVSVQGSTSRLRGGHWQTSYLPLADDGVPCVGVVLTDVTEREAAVAETRRRLAQQAALADLGQQALLATSLDAVFTLATDTLVRELDSPFAGVLERDESRGDLVMRAGTGFPPGAVGAVRAAGGPASQPGYTIATGAPVITGDATAEERFTFTAALVEEGVRSAISVPIPGEDEAFGVLGVMSDQLQHFDEADGAFVRSVANVLGAAIVRTGQEIELAELAAQRGTLVAEAMDAGERERRQIADVLHDEALQHLLFARLELGALDADASEALQRVEASIEAAAALLRGVVGGLHPVTLEHAGLRAAIEGLAAEHAPRGLAVEVEVAAAAEGVRDRLVFSLSRELLANVVKHAGASRALVRVASADDVLELSVLDDGQGLAAQTIAGALARGNVGLATARERVAAIGGTIDLGRGLGGRGAGVTVRLPLADVAAGHRDADPRALARDAR